MATTLQNIRYSARRQLNELIADFWSDDELLDICNQGIKDLWGAIIDLHQEHFFTNDATNVSMAADTSTLTGVPTDVFRVLLIEPRVVTSGTTGRYTQFIPRDYNSPEFVAARMLPAQASDEAVIYYAISQAGGPVGAPTIHVAPQITSALTLRLTYIPVQAAVVATGSNPIPGESDHALTAWIIAYAKAKEREDGSPDPNWLAVYGTEKQNILVRLTPRQEHEPEYVVGMFEEFLL